MKRRREEQWHELFSVARLIVDVTSLVGEPEPHAILSHHNFRSTRLQFFDILILLLS